FTAPPAPDPGRQPAAGPTTASCWKPESMCPGGATTQLARPDPARSRSQEHVRPAPAPAPAEPWPADLPGLWRPEQPVPGWAVGTSFLAPVVLVGGWLIAGALQPASYSPMRQTMSVLAGQSGTDRWVMTVALLVVGGCQIAT